MLIVLRLAADNVILAGAVVAAFASIWRFAIRPAHHAISEEMANRRQMAALIERELTNNGGSSLKDKIENLDHSLHKLDARVVEFTRESREDRTSIHADVDTLLRHDRDRDVPGARYAEDADG